MNISDKLLYLAAGCGIGAVLGALFAPQSGQQTRQELSNRMDDLRNRVGEKINSSGIRETASQTLQSAMDKGKKVVGIGEQRLNDSIEAAKRRFNQSLEDDYLAER